jgi:galactose mutarotase-like enzyme
VAVAPAAAAPRGARRAAPPGRPRDGAPEPEDDAAIATRRFDDHYLLGDDRRFVLADERRRLTVRFGPAYPRAQLYVPEAAEVVCIEPMTAPVNALPEATATLLGPGQALVATWSVAVAEM